MLAQDSITNPEGQGGLLGGIRELDDREGFLSLARNNTEVLPLEIKVKESKLSIKRL